MTMNITALIPARYDSSRLTGKPLLEIAGKPMILHVVERTKMVAAINRVIVATDDERIFAAVKQAKVFQATERNRNEQESGL